MVNIAWFKDISKDSVALVGGKAANLGELSSNNFPVPNGFVVTADAYKLFLAQTKIQEQIDKILEHLDIEDSDKLNEASDKIQDLILSADMPYEVRLDVQKAYRNINVGTDIATLPAEAAKLVNSGRDTAFVAVRSSATAEDLPTASFAGQQATYLNVRGTDHVTKAVHQCWASLYTPRAIYYREKNGFEHSKVYIAVVVQKMINSEKSGVIFTMNPVNNDENEIILEAGYGLGDAVVSGAISPNRYVVEKDYWKLKDKKIPGQEWMFSRDPNSGRTIKIDLSEGKSKKQVLEDDEIIVLAKLAGKIEKHYGKPQDIEYAIENNRLYIVQSRDITTKKKVEEVKEEEVEGEVILEGLSASPGVGTGTVKIVNEREELSKVEKGDVLVARMTSPDMVPAMERAAAIVTDEGGSTCHAAIVSRELGIPCVVGTEKATEVLKESSTITVDGSNGKIYSGEAEVEPEKIEMDVEVSHAKTVTKVKVNVDISQAVERAVETNADGVGLARLEFIIAEKGIHPLKYVREGREEEYTNYLVEKLREIAKPFGEKPVWVRTSDIRSDELDGELVEKESNPMLGWRGVRMSLDEKKLLKAELKAIRRLRVEGIRNISVMIPFITHVEQVEKVKEIINDLDLDCELGVMIETPASVEIIDDLCSAGIKFVSIGLDELAQFTLAVDRNNERVAGLFSELHPAVLKQIRRVIRKCKEYNVESSICGQAGSNEEMVKKLVKCGIGSISANIDSVGKTRNLVAEEERKLLESARDSS